MYFRQILCYIGIDEKQFLANKYFNIPSTRSIVGYFVLLIRMNILFETLEDSAAKPELCSRKKNIIN